MASWNLVKQGWDNLKKISQDGLDGLVDVLTPSGGDIVKQVKNIGGAGPAPAIVTVVPEVVPAVVDPVVTTVTGSNVWKYAKYALVGGAALLAYSVLKK